MSTDLGEVEGPDHHAIKVTRFYGGKRRGVMYQLTETGGYVGIRGDYIQVSAEQLFKLKTIVSKGQKELKGE